MLRSLAPVLLLLFTLTACANSDGQHTTDAGEAPQHLTLPRSVHDRMRELAVEWGAFDYLLPLRGDSVTEPVWTGRIRPGDHAHVMLTIPPGHEGFVAAVGAYGVDIDLEVFDAERKLVGSDNLEDSWPVVSLASGGSYEVIIHNRDSRRTALVGMIFGMRRLASAN